MNISAIITAAGLSSRMKAFKPLMKIGDRTMAERVIDNLKEAGASEIIVVTGFKGEELENALADTGVKFVRNNNYENTQMFDSVKIGLSKLISELELKGDSSHSCGRILFTPVDVPMTSPDTIRKLLRSESKIVVPQYNGRLGHPVSIDRTLLPSIMEFSGEYGLRGALESTGEKITRVIVDDPGVISDADTQSDYQRLLKLDGIRKRIILVRHATPEEYKGNKKYVGRTDVQLGFDGIREANLLAKWFADNTNISRIYSSPLSRAEKTGQIIANESGSGDVIKDNRLLEIDTGDWEGIEIKQIKSLFPKEYSERGKNIYNRKFPGGESFCEASARFESFINEIIQENSDKKETIVVVSHSGIICAYLARLGIIKESDVRSIPLPCCGMVTLTVNSDYSIEASKVGTKPIELLTEEEVDYLYNKYEVPMHIRAHMRAVADWQDMLLDQLEKSGRYHDRILLRKAALLHDIARLQKGHAEVGAGILNKEGFPSVAAIVGEHHSSVGKTGDSDGDGTRKEELTMGDILFYSDKRIQETNIVSIDERFALNENKHSTEKLIKKRDDQMRRARSIEEMLVKCIGNWITE